LFSSSREVWAARGRSRTASDEQTEAKEAGYAAVKTVGDMTNAELAARVRTHLRIRGIDAVLSGGACVSIYRNDKHVSTDLYLINTRIVNGAESGKQCVRSVSPKRGGISLTRKRDF
jgi:hypothetical protein